MGHSYLFGYIIAAAVAYWVYTDATKRGMNAVLWAILSFVCFPITPIIYLIIRKPATS